jgi:hypothetical protein
MKRHPQLSLITPECTSLMSAVGVNKPQVSICFYGLRERMNNTHFPPSKIYKLMNWSVMCAWKQQSNFWERVKTSWKTDIWRKMLHSNWCVIWMLVVSLLRLSLYTLAIKWMHDWWLVLLLTAKALLSIKAGWVVTNFWYDSSTLWNMHIN